MKNSRAKKFISLFLMLLMLFGSAFGMSLTAYAEEEAAAAAESAEPAATAPAEEAAEEPQGSEPAAPEAPAPTEAPAPAEEPEKEKENPAAQEEKTPSEESRKEAAKKEDQDTKKQEKQQAPKQEEHQAYSAPWLSSSDIPIDDDQLMVLITFFREELRLNKSALAGMLANIHRESGFDYVKVGDYGNAFGLCQWRSDRLDMLVAYCDENDLNPVTLEGQLAYLLYEIQVYYPNLCIYFDCCEESEDDAAWAAYYVCRAYEVPTELDEECEVREEFAREIYYPKILELEEQGLLPAIPED